ncbi:YlbL family protein [Glycomyces arizonensis]|uniref:YlbL family protein n=1 Tax=Glycomyces arizonensis TaxID=256035 RepID=UPI0004199D85|nr:S16 family serine protease [Glycomyces arizonensis]
MKRRGITVLIGAALVALLTWQSLSMDVAYVVMGPGPTEDVLGAVTDEDDVEHQIITADVSYETSGELRLTTVRVKQSVTLAQALRYWMSDEHAIIPRDLIYPPDQSQEEITAEQEADWVESQSNAEQAALAYLDQPAEIRAAADGGGLSKGDILLQVEGTPVDDLTDLEDFAEGETEVTVDRDGTKTTVSAALGEAELQLNREDPYGIEIDTSALNIGGPSAGMIFALGIVDTVTEGELTGGLTVAGTGEIDPQGNVGGIGGIQQKIMAAADAGAEVFLSPATNCADAVSVAPENMTIVKVETLTDAVAALESITAGEAVATC